MNDVGLLLTLIEKAGYDPNNINRTVQGSIEELETRIRDLEQMSDQEFMRMISRSIFGVASKDYYVSQGRKRIETLKQMPERIEYLLNLRKENKELFEHVLRNSYKGHVRQMKESFKKLVEDLKFLSVVGRSTTLPVSLVFLHATSILDGGCEDW